MTQPSFFPGNNLLLEKTLITTDRSDASAIQLQVGSDLTTMKTFKFKIWRPVIASRYAADPLVMELLHQFEIKHNQEEERDELHDTLDIFNGADEPQTWQSIFP